MARFKLFLQLVVLATLGSIVLFYSCFPVAETQRGVKSGECPNNCLEGFLVSRVF